MSMGEARCGIAASEKMMCSQMREDEIDGLFEV